MSISENIRGIVIDKLPSLRTQKDAEKWRNKNIWLHEGKILALEHYYNGHWITTEQDTAGNNSWQSKIDYGPKDTTYLIVSQDQQSSLEETTAKHIILANPNLKGVQIKISIGSKTELAKMTNTEKKTLIEYQQNVDYNAPINPPPSIKMEKVKSVLFTIKNLGIPIKDSNLPNLQNGIWNIETLNNESVALSSNLEIGTTAKLVFGDWTVTLTGENNNKLMLSYNKSVLSK